MFDIGGFELLVIAALALIVVGPKELPGLIRNVGRWVQRARSLAREFQNGMNDIADEADLKKVGDIGSDLKRDMSSLGAQTEKMLNQPMGPSSRDVSGGGTSGSSSRSTTSADASAPKVRDVDVEPPLSDQRPTSTPPRAANGASANGAAPKSAPREDDEAFLERFQRGVQGDN
ncbi:MAG: Sec-independent protein translocase protein TatB [Pseudomonadota bacterium]